MTFKFRGRDISHLKGKQVIWSGVISENLRYPDEFKDEEAKVLDFFMHDGKNQPVIVIEGHRHTYVWSEDDLAKVCTDLREATPEEKAHVEKERKDKADKNFRAAVAQLLNGYPDLNLEEKREIFESVFRLKQYLL